MAASAFSVYNEAKKYIMNGTVQLATTALKLKLCNSASNAATLTLSTFASVNNEISATGGYVANGKALASMAVSSIVSAKSYSFDAADLIFTASGASLKSIKYAVVGVSGGKVVCYSKLTATAFGVTSPNTLTITFHANGLFEMH